MIDSYLKDSAFTDVNAKVNKVCERGTMSIGAIRKGYLFREKLYIKG